ncbi:MAG: AAA family ATPase [Zoogloea sp.]|nr:AAA family ATPase [Zoogloea sp.]MCA0187618.1 AAA family ATPase [Pseudomonadota bacterium]
MTQIEKLTVKGYKSIARLENFALRPLNVLIGANGAGKSNFIGLFKFLHAMYEQQLQLYVQKQGGIDSFLHFGRRTTPQMEMAFWFPVEGSPHVQQGYRFSLAPSTDNRLLFESEECRFLGSRDMPVVNPDFSLGQGHAEARLKDAQDPLSNHVRPAVGSWRVYHFHDTSDAAAVKRIHPVNDNLRLKPDAANLAPYLSMLHGKHPQEYRRIIETIRLVLPFFDDFVHRNDEEYVQLEWLQVGHSDSPFKAHLLSDGSLRFICLVTLLLQPAALLPDTILVDEPELGLHPYAISILADIFKQVAEDKQLIVSTQSVELINELNPDDVIVVDQEQGASSFKRLTAAELSDWLQDYALGELWKRNILGGRP